MAGVASSDWVQPTGGEDGGEIRNCFSGSGGAKRELPICKVWRDETDFYFLLWFFKSTCMEYKYVVLMAEVCNGIRQNSGLDPVSVMLRIICPSDFNGLL